jgi:hypothetical protein
MAQRDHRGMTTVRAPVFRRERLNLTVPIRELAIVPYMWRPLSHKVSALRARVSRPRFRQAGGSCRRETRASWHEPYLTLAKLIRESYSCNLAVRCRIVENFELKTMISATESPVLQVVALRGVASLRAPYARAVGLERRDSRGPSGRRSGGAGARDERLHRGSARCRGPARCISWLLGDLDAQARAQTAGAQLIRTRFGLQRMVDEAVQVFDLRRPAIGGRRRGDAVSLDALLDAAASQ